MSQLSSDAFIVRRVAVLGAGVMGAQIAAQLSNAGVETLLFDLPPKEGGDKNAIAKRAIDALRKQSPAPLAAAWRAEGIQPANYEEHLPLLKGCELVIEAIAERRDWKADLYQKVAPYLNAQAIFASNTSGLSIEKLAQACPAALRARFCGIHFFNPPRYMHLVEIIPTTQNDAAMLDRLETFLTTTVGKGVVRAKDTPNFVANRVGVFSMLATVQSAQNLGLRCDVVDDLTGARMGRPKSATFRTADVVGLDTLAHVVKTMQEGLPEDPWHALFTLPEWTRKLIESGALGAKSKAGVYKKVGKQIQVIDPARGEYVDGGQKGDDAVKELMKIKDFGKRLAKLRDSKYAEAQFVWSCYREVFHYVAVHLGSIARSAREIDCAMRWGFGWKQGPFELWQSAGWKQVIEWIEADMAAGKTFCKAPLPAWVKQVDSVHSAAGSYGAASDTWVARSTLPVYRRQLYPVTLQGEPAPVYGETVFENEGVRAWADKAGKGGDGVLVLSITNKAHAISHEVLQGINQAIDIAEARFKALVLWSPDEPFSVGADLKSMMPAFAAGDWANIRKIVELFQNTSQHLRYSQVPTVAAVRGYAFGGGCEFVMHCDRVVAHLESYIGLVEVGVGLLPAGGGCKEFALRAAQSLQGADWVSAIKDKYLNIAMAQVARSAEEAKELGYLRASDVIVFHPYELLYVAKQQALALAESGYRAPIPRRFPVAGRSAAASIRGQLINMREGNFISDYDLELALLIADIMTGGDLEAGTLVDESWILRREADGFMKLLQQEKTLERIAYMLENNKPLRN